MTRFNLVFIALVTLASPLSAHSGGVYIKPELEYTLPDTVPREELLTMRVVCTLYDAANRSVGTGSTDYTSIYYHAVKSPRIRMIPSTITSGQIEMLALAKSFRCMMDAISPYELRSSGELVKHERGGSKIIGRRVGETPYVLEVEGPVNW
jgi:hypothetical protein